MATIITKNSSTASAAPAVGDLTKGELAVNVTDKKLYTKDNSAAIVKIVGSLGNQEASAVAITGGSIAGITDLAVADGGTGASSAADARTNLGVTATGADTAYAFRSNNLSDLASASTARTNLGLGTIATQAASSVTITGGSVTGITDITVADGGTGASTAANARTNLGAAASGANSDITSITGLTTALTVAQGGTGVTTSTGTGNAVLSNSPTLVTPTLGTPASATLTNATGLPISTGVSGLGTGVATALAVNVGSTGAAVVNGGALGTPSSGTATNLTGLPLSTGVTGTLPVANGGTGVTTSTGSGNNVLSTSPTLVTPILGTPTSATLTNATGLPLSTGVTGTLPVANGGTGTATPSIVAGTNVTVTGTWPNQTIAASGGGGGGTPGGSTTQVQYNNAGAFGGITGATTNGTALTLVAPVLGTPASATLTNATGLPLSTGVTGTLPIANGGSGQTTATAAFNALAPSQTSNSGKYLTTDGTNTSWATVSGGSSQWTTSGSDIYYNTGAVSVGTSTPLLTASGRGNVTINGSTNSILVLANGGTTSGYMFGDASSLGFSAGSGTNSRVMTFDTNGSERMRIDSSGNLGLGVTPTATSSTGIFQNQGGILWAFSNLFQDLTQNAYYDTNYKYSVTSYAATFYRQQGGSHQWYTSPTGTAGNAITFTQSLAVGKGTTLALEGATSQTGTGITFPATQSASTDANTLDDYEEGSWTPNFSPASGSFTSITWADQTGRYVKVGRMVIAWGSVYTNSITVGTASGDLQISGLPFSVASGTSAERASGSVANCQLWNTLGNPESVGNVGGGTTIYMYKRSTAGGDQSRLQVSDANTGTNRNSMNFTFIYPV